MLCIQNERHFQCSNRRFRRVASPEHSQNILRERIVAIGRHGFFALYQAMPRRHHYGQLREQPFRFAIIGGVAAIGLIRIPMRKQTGAGAHHIHHVGLWWNMTQNLNYLGGHRRVLSQSIAECGQLIGFRQLAVK